jgi:hypothetical protein
MNVHYLRNVRDMDVGVGIARLITLRTTENLYEQSTNTPLLQRGDDVKGDCMCALCHYGVFPHAVLRPLWVDIALLCTARADGTASLEETAAWLTRHEEHFTTEDKVRTRRTRALHSSLWISRAGLVARATDEGRAANAAQLSARV